ncbi:MAG TPA: DUF1707 domain-containing protein [Acidimicrobiales bacterium]|nr:DUF1707 domain-containing protein [Acidimicrobiales bacterium]
MTDAERQRLADGLRQHLVEGRLSLEEFEARVGIVLEAEHREDADRAFADLPPLAPGGRKRGRRHGEAAAPEAHWRATTEVFRDPTSGRLTRVWVDPLDGSRHYVVEG